MTRHKQLPLTETTYYVLLALMTPAHGYLIMSRVEELSLGQVRIAPGTLYGALDTLVKRKFIDRAPSDDPRRKVYRITPAGKDLLAQDAQRMAHMVALHSRAIGE